MPIDEERPLDPAAAAMIAKVRRMMLISGLITMVGIAAVLGVVGYRVFSMGGASAPRGEGPVTAALPQGARVIATALTGERIMVTLEAGGATELHLFDAATLAPRGRLVLRPAP